MILTLCNKYSTMVWVGHVKELRNWPGLHLFNLGTEKSPHIAEREQIWVKSTPDVNELFFLHIASIIYRASETRESGHQETPRGVNPCADPQAAQTSLSPSHIALHPTRTGCPRLSSSQRQILFLSRSNPNGALLTISCIAIEQSTLPRPISPSINSNLVCQDLLSYLTRPKQ